MINVIFFGQLTDIAGSSTSLDAVATLFALEQVLHEKFPLLKQNKYVFAVNQKIVFENVTLADGCTVALLPPFSGG